MMEFGRLFPHNISIEPTENKGMIVRVGCQTFASRDVEEVIQGISEYMRDPEKTLTDFLGGRDKGCDGPMPTTGLVGSTEATERG
jgi:hypothetical protein